MSDLVSVKRWAKLSDWNPLSPPQVMAYLKRMKYPIPRHRTERDEQGERKATTNDESLSDLFLKTQDPVLDKVLEIRHTSKALAYLSDRYVYSDGRLHPIYTMKPKQRLSSAKPNVMNFPKGKKGEVLKRAADAVLSSIIADDGWVLFSCDWNSLHPALIAYFAQDPGYARIARLGDHAYVLSHFLGKPVDLERPDELVKADLEALKESNPGLYKTCKIGNLAYKYLQGEVNMAKTLGLTLEETRRIRAAIDKASPKVAAWKWSVLEQAHFQGKLVTPFGLCLTFFDIFKTKGGKVMMRDGRPMLGSEAPEAVAFMPLGTESGMLREVLVDLGTHPEHEDSFQLLMPEHDKVIGQIKEDQVDRVLREIIIPCMGRGWGELGGLKVGVDVEVGRRLQECKCKAKPCEAGHMVPWRQGA